MTKLLIAGPSSMVCRTFLSVHRIRRTEAIIISGLHVSNGLGVLSHLPFYLLPGWDLNPASNVAVRDLLARGKRMKTPFQVILVPESSKTPVVRLCANDTNNDGDCHLCAHLGGCPFPNPPSTPRLDLSTP